MSDDVDGDGLTEIDDVQTPLSAEPGELDNETKLAMLTAFVEEHGLTLSAQAITSGELPHTGGVGLPLWYTAGGVMIAAAALIFAGRREEDEI